MSDRIAVYNLTLLEKQSNSFTVKYPGITDATGYSVEAKIYTADSASATVLASFTVGTLTISGGKLVIPLTLSQANTTTVLEHMSTPKNAFYRIKLITPTDSDGFFFLKGKILQEQLIQDE